MIIGIGTDIIDIVRIKDVIEKHPENFINRCFTKNEQENANKKNNENQKISFYAKRWAAKEACAKALGTGIGKIIGLHDIEISNNTKGKPIINLSETAKTHLNSKYKNQNIKIELSLSDEKNFALAFVVISVE